MEGPGAADYAMSENAIGDLIRDVHARQNAPKDERR
jgi:hypothetical protein